MYIVASFQLEVTIYLDPTLQNLPEETYYMIDYSTRGIIQTFIIIPKKEYQIELEPCCQLEFKARCTVYINCNQQYIDKTLICYPIIIIENQSLKMIFLNWTDKNTSYDQNH